MVNVAVGAGWLTWGVLLTRGETGRPNPKAGRQSALQITPLPFSLSPSNGAREINLCVVYPGLRPRDGLARGLTSGRPSGTATGKSMAAIEGRTGCHQF